MKDRAIDSIFMNGNRMKRFEEPDNHSNLPKLYVVKSGSEIVYIGQTTRNMRRRLYDGLNAQGETGYYGYMWKDLPEVCILVWCFDNKNKGYVETLEGEIVFLLRKRNGKWPMHQMEIHFHNAETNEIEVAQEIFEEAIK